MGEARTPRILEVPAAITGAGTRWRRTMAWAAGGMLCCLALCVSSASADTTICSAGSGAGHCTNPHGVAADFETGHIYVADEGNNRVDAFQSDGTSLGSFGAGQLTSPAWAAVDNSPTSASRHDVWVTTEKGAGAEFLVKKFEPNGTFLEADSFGDPAKQGTGECEFKANDPIAVGPEGHVYIGDAYKEPLGGSKALIVGRVIVFDPSGSCLEEFSLTEFEGEAGGSYSVRSLAVDSTGHIYFRVDADLLRKYSPAGAFEISFDGTLQAEGTAVDAADKLFVKQANQLSSPAYFFFAEYSPTGAVLKRFGYQAFQLGEGLHAPALAAYHSPGGDLISSERKAGETSVVRYRSLPPAGPVIAPRPCEVKTGTLGNHKATLVAEVNPEGKSTTSHFEYITAAKFAEDGNSFGSGTEETEESEPIGADFELHEASALAQPLVPETEYRCRVVASNADGSITGEEGSFTTKQPVELGETTVSDVTTEEATLNASVNPLGIPTSGFFEYVEEATYLKDVEELGPGHGFDHAEKAPNVDGEEEEPIDFGAGEEFKLGSVGLSGLAPSTSYLFRAVVTDDLISPSEIFGPTEVFRTFGLSEGLLPDGRAYELVSPGQKSNAEVAVPGNPAGFVEDRSIRIQAGAGDGEAVTYTSWTSFGEAEGAPATSQYLSKRTEAGWITENVSPFGHIFNPILPPYVGFTPDMDFGIFKMTEPPLTDDCRKGGLEDLYRRDNSTGRLDCLSPEVPGGPESPCLIYAGASEDGSHLVIAGRPEGGGNSTYRLYEWTPEGIEVVSVLPGGEVAPPTAGTAFGPGGNSFSGSENCQVTRTRLRNAISADGSKVFWTFVPEASAHEPSKLYVRVNGSETLQLDAIPAKNGGKGPAGEGVFWAASADGSVAYFTDTGRLLKGSKAEAGSGFGGGAGKPDLYRYEVGQPKPLTDLTEGEVPGDVQGVIGASDDGSYVYFVAKAALGGEEENEAGEKAEEGKNNLYLFHEGAIAFIAALSPQDIRNWTANPRGLSARVSPDGKSLAFLSIESEALAGYDNTIATGEHCSYELTIEGNTRFGGTPKCAQAFLYDAETAKLTCASCNPSGARPLGPSLVPGWTNGFEGPRFLSDDGKRVFFESFDALSQDDVNGKLDVYEFELAGAGGCTNESPSFDPASGGCHFLLSSGKSEDESFLVDASSDGRDVFLSTREQLTGWDTNENFDVYDTRVGGGFPEPPPVESPCEGEGCKQAIVAAPAVSRPTTPHTENSGNVHQATKPRCPKGRHVARRAGKPRCVKRHEKSKRQGRHRRHETGGRG